MSTTADKPAPLNERVGALLRALRGEVSVSEVARRLGIVRQGVLKLEEGRLSLVRLDQLAKVYGVRFEVLAVDATTGQPVELAPGLAEPAS